MTSIAFTGTREGMSIKQWAKTTDIAEEYLKAEGPHQVHTGDCKGADTQFHTALDVFRLNNDLEVVMHGHPCNIEKWRAYNDFDVLHDIKPPLVRNRVMVDAADVLIAGPFQYHEQFQRSGTWATIRYAKLHKVELYIVWPDGSVTHQDYS